MAEIEHYVDPLDKQHARFNEVKDVKLALLPKYVQSEGKTDTTQMKVGDAVGQVRPFDRGLDQVDQMRAENHRQ